MTTATATGMMTPREITLGRLSLLLAEGDLRRIRLDGVEVLRRVSYPVRDRNWGTVPVTTLSDTLTEAADRFDYTHRFAARDGSFTGDFRATATITPAGAQLSLSVALDAPAEIAVNRAGFTLLHPLRGVAGAPLTVTHSDGTVQETRWPRDISPSQPVFDIAGLAHTIAGIRIDTRMSGEVFEMEDQRNWTDASYKTYCRPLRLPLPFALGPAAPVRQTITLSLTGQAETPTEAAQPLSGTVPALAIANEPGLTTALLPGFLQHLRLRPGDPVPALQGPVALEIVVNERLDGLPQIAAACAGLHIARVTALTEPYLKSHQPEGPWPLGPTPMDLIPQLRALFPGAQIGGGMLTNFTEFNRCPPDPALVDFVTFSGTAIVHAADDLSVFETLEALPHVFATAHRIAAGKPLHLGLSSIAMRSNPYAADCLPNPALERLAMVRDDPRQDTRLAASFAAGVLAAATAGGVASLALAMADGPLGALGPIGPRPLYHLLRFANALSGAPARVELGDIIAITTAKGSILAAIAGGTTLPATAKGWLMNEHTETRAVDWLDQPPTDLGGAWLGPNDLAFLMAEGA